jgi:hypothetical protein
MRLRQVQTLTPYVDAIEALGYRGDDGLEELIGTVQVAAPEFAQYLGIPIDQLIAVMNDATQHATALSKSTLDIISNAVYSLGYAIEQATPPLAAPTFCLARRGSAGLG